MVSRIGKDNKIKFFRNKIPPTEHSQLIRGARFGEIQIKKTGVDVGSFSAIGLSRLKTRALPSPSRAPQRPTSIVCFENKNELRKNVPIIEVGHGETAYFGHMEITLKLLPPENASGVHPAVVTKIRHLNAPQNFDQLLREAGIDTKRVKRINKATQGCRYGNLSLRSQ